MQVLLSDNGYISSFAWEGELVGGIDIPEPADPSHFAEHYSAYKLVEGAPSFDSEKEAALLQEEAIADYRLLREQECFSVINRGQFWYDTLTDSQRQELKGWYRAWLDGTPTQTIPDKPEWLT